MCILGQTWILAALAMAAVLLLPSTSTSEVTSVDLFDLVAQAEMEVMNSEAIASRSNKHGRVKWTKESRAMSDRTRVIHKATELLLASGAGSEDPLSPEVAKNLVRQTLSRKIKREQRLREQARSRDKNESREKHRIVAAGQGMTTRGIHKMDDTCNTKQVQCDKQTQFRLVNGQCNNLANPYWGTSSGPFKRLVPAIYADDKGKIPRGGFLDDDFPVKSACRDVGDGALPNVRAISTAVHGDENVGDTKFTLAHQQVGQFLTHDMTMAPEEEIEGCCADPSQPNCFPFMLPKNDTFKRPVSCLSLTRTVAFCEERRNVREQLNTETAYIDSSNVYGANDEIALLLRSGLDGQLKFTKSVHGKQLLPFINEEYIAGDVRAQEMPGLASMHTLFLREHNRIAKYLAGKTRKTDEELYQLTRRIVGAEWQHVVYNEYLPIVLGQQSMDELGINVGGSSASGRTQYDPAVKTDVSSAFATAAFRFGHSQIQGLIEMMATQGGGQAEAYRLRDNHFNLDRYFAYGGEGMERILMGMINQQSHATDRFMTDDVTNFLFANIKGIGTDLAARNIQRGRDHGLPSYNSFRESCGMSKLCNWEDRPEEISEENWSALRSVYNQPSDVELFPAGMSEKPWGGGIVGRTFNCIIGKQFQDAMKGDRFFFTHEASNGVTGAFSDRQLMELRWRRLGDIICENTDIHETPIYVFKLKSGQLKCNKGRRMKLDVFMQK